MANRTDSGMLASHEMLGPERRSLLRRWPRELAHLARRKPLGAFGAGVLMLMVIMALGAEWIAPFDPNEPAVPERLQGPSLDHLMGTDHLGRDLFSRIVHGAKPSLYTGLFVVVITGALGLVLGTASAYIGGTFDLLVQRIVDGIEALPGLILAMALLSVFSSGVNIGPLHLPLVWHQVPLMIVATLVVVLVPSTSRVIRSATFGIAFSPYIEAARATGCSTPRILARHIVPNVFAPLIVVASAQLGGVILIEASLSFLGLGSPPPHPRWGAMLQSDGRRYMEVAPWLAIFPGIAISLAVLAFNLFGDALRDLLDPRLRGAGGNIR